jgi:hypothetical protein
MIRAAVPFRAAGAGRGRACTDRQRRNARLLLRAGDGGPIGDRNRQGPCGDDL